MPTYKFICENCGECRELFQSMKESLPEKCSECGASEPEFHQEYGAGVAIVYGEDKITTVGQQAEFNAKRVGKEQLQIMAEKNPMRKRGKTPWWRTGEVEGTKKLEKPLDLSQIKDTRKYIETGEKC